MEKDTKNFRKIAIIVTTLVITALLVFLATQCTVTPSDDVQASNEQATPAAPDTLDVATLVVKVQECSRLYTTEYKVHKIVTHEDQKVLVLAGKKVNVPLTGRHIAIPMDATLKAYVDMSQFTTRNIATDGQRIIITLPDPKIEVTSTIVEHGKTQEHVSWIRSNYTAKEQEELHRQGLASITQNVLNNGILENARSSAARLLVPMLQQMGYEEQNIEVRFGQTEYTVRDLPTLLDSKTIKF